MTKILSIALLLFSFSLYAQKNNQIIDKYTKYSSSQDSIVLSPVKAIPINNYTSNIPKSSVSTTEIETKTTNAVIVADPVKVNLVSQVKQTSSKSIINNSENSVQPKHDENIIEMPAINAIKQKENSTGILKKIN